MEVLSRTLGKVAKSLDREFGIKAMLKGEPRPPKGGFDLAGEKLLDWGWICVNLPSAPKRALEIGCGESPVLPAMIAKGYDVTGVDFDPAGSNPISGFKFIQGDFTAIDFPNQFDIVVACSVVEHIGLSGRYGSSEDPDGDLKAMRKVRSLLTPEGIAFITVPVGMDVVHRPWHRVYGPQRFPLLLDGFFIVHSRFMVKEAWGPWHEKDQDTALSFPVNLRGYALGELMLKRG